MRAPERAALPLRPAATLARSYGLITQLAGALADEDFELATGCAGLAVGPLLVHLKADAERALVALASPTSAEPDRDFVTYWHDFPGAPAGPDGPREPAEADAGVRFARAVAAAYERPSVGLVQHWTTVSAAAARAAGAAAELPDARVITQGHVLAVPDFLATLVVEATIHHLDLIVNLPDAPGPDPEGLRVTARTLDGLFGPEAWDVIDWDTTTYVLKATGRLPLTSADVAALGSHADRLPLLG